MKLGMDTRMKGHVHGPGLGSASQAGKASAVQCVRTVTRRQGSVAKADCQAGMEMALELLRLPRRQ